MRKFILPTLLVIALTSVFAGGALADGISSTLTLTNCGASGSACPGATYNFTASATSATLAITIGGVPGGNPLTSNNDTLTAVDLGFLPQNQFASLSPTVNVSFNGTTGTWAGSLDSLNNGNCTTNGGAFACATGAPIALLDGNTYTFTWNYTLTSQGAANLLTDTSVHIGANYGSANGLIVSETSPVPTPEPSSLMLLGAGMLALVVLAGVKGAK